MKHFKTALKIREESLPPGHPGIIEAREWVTDLEDGTLESVDDAPAAKKPAAKAAAKEEEEEEEEDDDSIDLDNLTDEQLAAMAAEEDE